MLLVGGRVQRQLQQKQQQQDRKFQMLDLRTKNLLDAKIPLQVIRIIRSGKAQLPRPMDQPTPTLWACRPSSNQVQGWGYWGRLLAEPMRTPELGAQGWQGPKWTRLACWVDLSMSPCRTLPPCCIGRVLGFHRDLIWVGDYILVSLRYGSKRCEETLEP